MKRIDSKWTESIRETSDIFLGFLFGVVFERYLAIDYALLLEVEMGNRCNRDSKRYHCEEALGNKLQGVQTSRNSRCALVHWDIGEFVVHYRVRAE